MMVKQEGETLIQHCSHAGGERQPHCAAIASAIPWNVVERSFHLSFDGGRSVSYTHLTLPTILRV